MMDYNSAFNHNDKEYNDYQIELEVTMRTYNTGNYIEVKQNSFALVNTYTVDTRTGKAINQPC